MNSPSTRAAGAATTLWILHVAFINALVIYGVVVWFVRPEVTRPDLSATVFWSLVGVCVLLAALSFRLPDLVPGAEGTSGESADAYLARRKTGLVLMDACAEAGAVLGVAACFIGMIGFGQFVMLLLICLAALVAQVPRVSGWVGEYERIAARAVTVDRSS